MAVTGCAVQSTHFAEAADVRALCSAPDMTQGNSAARLHGTDLPMVESNFVD